MHEHLKYDPGILAERLAMRGCDPDNIRPLALALDFPAEMKPVFAEAEQADAYVARLFEPIVAALADLTGQNGAPADADRLLSHARAIFARFPPARRCGMAKRLFDTVNGRKLRVEAGLLGCLSETDADTPRFAVDVGVLLALGDPVAVEILLATLLGRHFFGYVCGIRNEEQLSVEEAENTLALFNEIERTGRDPAAQFRTLFETLQAVRRREPGASFSYIDCLRANVRKKDFAVPELIGGRYRPLAILGEGGMGIVFLAKNEETGSKAAVKITKGSEETLMRFIREVRLIRDVNHPYVIGIESFNTYGESGARHAYYAMRYCPWPTLKEWRDENIGRPGAGAEPPTLWRRNPDKLSLAEYVGIVVRVLQGLEAIHRHDLVHRDIKPENIKYDAQTCTPMILDFGLVKSMRTDESVSLALASDARLDKGEPGRTRAGTMLGTPGYMAPEQTDDASAADERADVFSAAVILCEFATGQRPFEGRNVYETINLALTQAPVAPSSLNPAVDQELEAIILKGLEKKPSERYQTASQMRAALEAFLEKAERKRAGKASGGGATRRVVRMKRTRPLPAVQPNTPKELVSTPAPAPAPVPAPSPEPPPAAPRFGKEARIAAALLAGVLAVGAVSAFRAYRSEPEAAEERLPSPWRGSWQKRRPAARAFSHAATAFDRRRGLYFVADREFSVTAYDPKTDTWMPWASRENGAGEFEDNAYPNLVCCLAGDTLLFVGGSGAYLFGLKAKTWSRADAEPKSRPALAGGEDAVFALFGADVRNGERSFLRFDARSQSWTELGARQDGQARGLALPPFGARPYDTMAYDSRRKRLVLFGPDAENRVSWTWSYDPVRNQWADLKPVAPLPVLRWPSVCYDEYNDLIVAHGDVHVEGRAKRQPETWVYDATSNAWFEATADSVPEDVGHIEYDPASRRIIAIRAYPGQAYTLELTTR